MNVHSVGCIRYRLFVLTDGSALFVFMFCPQHPITDIWKPENFFAVNFQLYNVFLSFVFGKNAPNKEQCGKTRGYFCVTDSCTWVTDKWHFCIYLYWQMHNVNCKISTLPCIPYAEGESLFHFCILIKDVSGNKKQTNKWKKTAVCTWYWECFKGHRQSDGKCVQNSLTFLFELRWLLVMWLFELMTFHCM